MTTLPSTTPRIRHTDHSGRVEETCQSNRNSYYEQVDNHCTRNRHHTTQTRPLSGIQRLRPQPRTRHIQKLHHGSCLYRIHIFSLKIINHQNIHKNILEISDQNRINIKVTFLYFSTFQLKTQNKNILENPAQKLINRKILGSKTNK